MERFLSDRASRENQAEYVVGNVGNGTRIRHPKGRPQTDRGKKGKTVP
jgi:hypothetical protein